MKKIRRAEDCDGGADDGDADELGDAFSDDSDHDRLILVPYYYKASHLHHLCVYLI